MHFFFFFFHNFKYIFIIEHKSIFNFKTTSNFQTHHLTSMRRCLTNKQYFTFPTYYFSRSTGRTFLYPTGDILQRINILIYTCIYINPHVVIYRRVPIDYTPLPGAIIAHRLHSYAAPIVNNTIWQNIKNIKYQYTVWPIMYTIYLYIYLDTSFIDICVYVCICRYLISVWENYIIVSH